ncbi:GYD domain-containing protein [Paucibacter soli]|uniref:GYD domain-containing protein n=1 Tax=Paucibacter soli TaxID=3133433 RepID=UPI0030A9AC1E
MASYTVLANFTDQGVKSLKETTHRAEAVEALGRKMGVTVKSIQWAFGSYDLVCQFEAADDQTIAAFGAAIAMQGNVRTQTIRTFSRDEMNAILLKLPA